MARPFDLEDSDFGCAALAGADEDVGLSIVVGVARTDVHAVSAVGGKREEGTDAFGRCSVEDSAVDAGARHTWYFNSNVRIDMGRSLCVLLFVTLLGSGFAGLGIGKMTRSVERCEWYRQLNGTGCCSLLQQVAGFEQLHEACVPHDACVACRQNFPPTIDDPNPIVASLMLSAAMRVESVGGLPGCDLEDASALRQRAQNHLPMLQPDESETTYLVDLADEIPLDAPPIAEVLPPPSHQTSTRIQKWAVGITTAGRRQSTVDRSISSVIRAGWDDIRLFVDADGHIPQRYSGLPATRHDAQLGAWANYYLALVELYQRNPHADAYMIVQDDVVLYPHSNLRDYLEAVLWPEQDNCVVSLFCSQLYANETWGWHRYRERWQWGAQAFVFSSTALRRFFSNNFTVDHCLRSDREIDTAIGVWAKQNAVPIYYPTPSLAQHIGHVSTLWDASRVVGGRKADPYLGDVVRAPAEFAVRFPNRDRASEPTTSANEQADSFNCDQHSTQDDSSSIVDCLSRAKVSLPAVPLVAENCIATIASDEMEHWLDDMLGSLFANGGCQDALVVVLIREGSKRCIQVAEKYGVPHFIVHPLSAVNPTFKSVMYSITRIVDAKRYLCLDADMLILKELRSIFSAIDSLPSQSIFVCRESNCAKFTNLLDMYQRAYHGSETDLASLGVTEREEQYTLTVNDGLFAGSRAALEQLDYEIRQLSGAVDWVDEDPQIGWRNQFIFNLMLARSDCGVELDARYNIQLGVQDVEIGSLHGRIEATWEGSPVHILHFTTLGRRPGDHDKYPEWRGRFSRVTHPVVHNSTGHSNDFDEFIARLRNWVGPTGEVALRWSLYGLPDGVSGYVSDPLEFSLFGLLYYLIRSSGCTTIFECGTGFGVSTACMSAAVANHTDGRVISVDIAKKTERDDLWLSMPDRFQSCIDAVKGDTLDVLDDYIARGEKVDLALLDSQHTTEHVWQEFERAKRLVKSGGLILVHDVLLGEGEVDGALRRIEKCGYGVSRLWSSPEIEAADNRLGLAVIVNSQQSTE